MVSWWLRFTCLSLVSVKLLDNLKKNLTLNIKLLYILIIEYIIFVWKNGFSVVELMATIGVIAVIAAIGFPAIDNFGEQENYESDLATIRGQINYVRQISLRKVMHTQSEL